MGSDRRGSEIKVVVPISVFSLLFSACFIITLIYCLAVNFDLLPRFSPQLIQQLREKIDPMNPVPKSLAYALLIGLGAGIGGTVLALVYNIFSNIFGGVRTEIKE